MGDTNEKNVILLSMSTLNSTAENYYYSVENEEKFIFCGRSQLEPGTKYIISHLARENKKLDRIVILETPESLIRNKLELIPVEYYKERIKNWLKGDEKWEYQDEEYQDAKFSDISEYFDQQWEDKKRSLNDKADNSSINKMIDEILKDISNCINPEESICSQKESKKVKLPSKKIERWEKNPMIRLLRKIDCSDEKYSILLNKTRKLNKKLVSLKEENEKLNSKVKKQEKEKETEKVRKYVKSRVICELYKLLEKNNVNESVKYSDSDISGLFCDVRIQNENDKQNSDDNYVTELINYLMFSDDESRNLKVNIYIDFQGGYRTFAVDVNAIIQLISGASGGREVEIKGRYLTAFNIKNAVNKIEEQSESYRKYRLITAMNAFKRYGRADDLLDYFGNGSEDNNIIKLIKDAADAISLCDVEKFDKTINDINNLDTSNIENPDMNIVFNDIKSDYEQLRAPEEHSELRYIKQISWCLEKGFIQQALTICEAKLPEVIVESGILYYENDETTADLFNKDRNLYNLKFDSLYKDAYQCRNVEHYFIKNYILHNNVNEKNKNKNLFKNKNYVEIKYNEVSHNHSELKSILRNTEYISSIINQYNYLANLRNDVNHSKVRDIKLDEIIEKLRKLCTDILLAVQPDNIDNSKKMCDSSQIIFNDDINMFIVKDDIEGYINIIKKLIDNNKYDKVRTLLMYAVPDIIVKSGIMYYGNKDEVEKAFNDKKENYGNMKNRNTNSYYLNTVLSEKKTNSEIMKTNLTENNDVGGLNLDQAWKIVSCYREYMSIMCEQKPENNIIKRYADTICCELNEAIINLKHNNKFMPSDIGHLSYNTHNKEFTFPKETAYVN